MYIISGIVCTFIMILVDVLWRKTIGQSVLSEYFVLGAYLVGAFVGMVTTKVMVKTHKKCTALRNYICIGICAFTFFSLSYTEYVQFKHEYSEIKSMISSSVEDDDNYFSFLADKLYREEIKISVGKRGRNHNLTSTGIMNYFIFAFQFIFIILGGVSSNKKFGMQYEYESISFRDYCSQCRKFKTKKRLFKADTKALKEISRNGSINVKDMEEFIRFIKKHRGKKVKNNVFFICTIIYCRKCSTGRIVIKKISSKEKKESMAYENTIEVSSKFVQAIDCM